MYGPGGFNAGAVAGNRAEEWDTTANTYTRWDTAGQVVETRPLTGAEVAALTPPTAPMAAVLPPPDAFLPGGLLTAGADPSTPLTWTVATAGVARALGWAVVTDFGASPDADAATNAAAFTAAIAAANGGTVYVPAGIYLTDTIPAAGPLNIVGANAVRTQLRNTAGSVLAVSGSSLHVRDITFDSWGGGPTVIQTGGMSQCHWSDFRILQGSGNFGVWDNAGYAYISMRMTHFYSKHLQSAEVPSWKLSTATGEVNHNTWENCLALYSGNYHFLIECTGNAYHFNNTFRNITFEVCTGGGVRILANRGYEIDNCVNWDMQVGTPAAGQRDFYSLDSNAGGIQCSGILRRLSRIAGLNAAGVVDVRLPSNGLGSGTVVESCRNHTTSDPFTIDLAGNPVFVVSVDDLRSTYTGTTGMVSIDRLGISVGGMKVRRDAAAPTTGTWGLGDRVWHTAPTAGGFEGWICTTAGTPGTWKTFGAISA